MPCLEISMPARDSKTRHLLVKELTETLANITGFPKESFGIRFLEYNFGEAANEGVIWDGRTGKPYIYIVLRIPELAAGIKADLIRDLTGVFVDCLKKPDWQPVIFINEYPVNNVGYDGLSIGQHKQNDETP